MSLEFDHVGMVVKNIENTMNELKKLFGLELAKNGPYSQIFEWEEGRFVMLPTNGVKIELLEPKAGPLLDFLKERGDGALCEICFRVNEIEKHYDRFKKMGLTPLDDFEGKPLIERKYTPSHTAKFFYLPRKGKGAAFEILELPAENTK